MPSIIIERYLDVHNARPFHSCYPVEIWENVRGPLVREPGFSGLTTDEVALGIECLIASLEQCMECGTPLTRTALASLPESGCLCFTCNFWLERISAHLESPRSFIIDGTAYFMGDEGARGFRGFGGATFRIRSIYNPTTIIRTSNLWCQGTIPEIFRSRLPDDAEFVRS